MFEFSLTEPHALSTDGAKRSRYTIARLKKLAAIAAKLERAGWPVWITMTGLAFEPLGIDRENKEDTYWEELPDRVADQLAALGVYEEFNDWAGKTVDQMPDGMAMWMWEPQQPRRDPNEEPRPGTVTPGQEQ
jgi:hypothetical protein